METETCKSVGLTGEVTLSDLVADVPESVLDRFIDYPDENGAIGPNKQGYIHARPQVTMTYLVEYAIRHEDESVLEDFITSLSYTFSHQTSAGDFEFVAPADAPTNQPPPAGRLAHETAIFGYGLGMSLMLLDQSEWYQQLPADHSAKQELTDLEGEMDLLLTFLETNVEVLQQADGGFPSRLLYDILAIYTLSGHLQDETAALLALPMLERVFVAQDNEGYFTIAEGWDSSYNGETVKLGLELYAMLGEPIHAELRSRLAQAVTCAANWQTTRILESGEITTEGNTLIYPGGETVGGREKKVDIEKTIRAFAYMGLLSGDQTYVQLMQQVLAFYQ